MIDLKLWHDVLKTLGRKVDLVQALSFLASISRIEYFQPQ